ncbi:MAG: HAMP domain-containing sensor histidine kinase, partial [Desulfuromonadales bacterium]|nr:HAMP domain-containing sensor histidine kinase [Desulfuromonadales bacterium]
YAELLLNEADTDGFDREQKREFLGYIYDKGEILKRIIDDMLDLGRIESRRPIILEKSDCEIVQLVRSTLEHLRKENPRYRFAMDCHTDGLVINIDQQKISQVFDNVLSNAVKYSPAGGLINVVGKVEGETLLISVTDQGIGMTAEQMERAFDKFYRADSSDTAVGGLGLGLSICKNIVEAHGGKIWMESALSEGTTVHFSLPLT